MAQNVDNLHVWIDIVTQPTTSFNVFNVNSQPIHYCWVSVLLWVSTGHCCVFAQGPMSSFLLELGPCFWCWGAGGGAGLCCFAQVLNTDRNGLFQGSYSKWGHSSSDVQLAFRQPHSHSYSALSFQYRLPLLTSLIAFSQSPGYVFDESIKTLCMAKQAELKSHQGSGVLYPFCIMLHIHLSLCIISSGVWHPKVWIPCWE